MVGWLSVKVCGEQNVNVSLTMQHNVMCYRQYWQFDLRSRNHNLNLLICISNCFISQNLGFSKKFGGNAGNVL